MSRMAGDSLRELPSVGAWSGDHAPTEGQIRVKWEIAIKIRTGKYSLPGQYELFMRRQIRQNRLGILGITVAHTAVVATLPLHHRDPFDCLLVAQSLAEPAPLVSADPVFDAYGVTRLW